MFNIISLVVTIIALIAWAVHRQQQRHKALLAKFREHNQRLGTAFPEDSVDSELILSDKGKKVVIAFDPQSQKLCMVDGSKDPGEVLDFSYIRKWQLKWTGQSGNGNLSFLKRSLRFFHQRSETAIDPYSGRWQGLWRHVE